MSSLREGIEKVKEKADKLRKDILSSRDSLVGIRPKPLQNIIHRRVGRFRQAIGDEGPLRGIRERIKRNISRIKSS